MLVRLVPETAWSELYDFERFRGLPPWGLNDTSYAFKRQRIEAIKQNR